MTKRLPRLFICVNWRGEEGSSCAARGSLELLAELERLSDGTVEIKRQKCLGFCEYGPNIRRDGTGIHCRVTKDNLAGILDGTRPSNLSALES